MKQYALALIGIFSVCSLFVRAQSADTVVRINGQNEFEDILSFEDSLSIFTLIDSLMELEAVELKSSMAIRLGYNSNASSSGRTLGIDQFGLSPGVSYYHKSGAYLDVTGYFSTEYDPKYYLNILSGGYIGYISPKWSFLSEYSRYFYSDLGDSVYISYKNSFSISNFFDVKPFTFRLDYTLLFGEQVGHRLLPGVMLNLEKRNWKKIDRILFYPSINVLFGSEQYEGYFPYATTLAQTIFRVSRGLPLYYYEKGTDFGIMNYAFTAPLSISITNWNFLLSYTYNIPKSLPNEEVALDNSGFIAAAITRYLRFK